MATDEERKNAARLLEIHKRNLQQLEEKKATYGLEAPVWITNQIEQEQADIAALLPLVPPPPSKKVQDFVTSVSGGPPGEIDLMMLFMQGTQINTRMTEQERLVKEQDEERKEQAQAIIEEQARASVWRMQTGETIETLAKQAAASEKRRQRGAWIYRIAILLIFAWIVLHQFGVFHVIGG